MQLHDIPGLQRHVARAKKLEDNWRDIAFLPVHEEICGVPVLQLTLRRLNILLFAQSPFLRHGSHPTAEDVAKFLWVLSPEAYTASPPPKFDVRRSAFDVRRFFRRRPQAEDPQAAFFARIHALDFKKSCRQIDRYLDRALLDRPASSGTGGVLISASFVAIMVDRIATAYGWPDEQILDTPVARLYQYYRLIRLRQNPDAPQISRLSDRVRGRIVNRFVQISNQKSEISNSPK